MSLCWVVSLSQAMLAAAAAAAAAAAPIAGLDLFRAAQSAVEDNNVIYIEPVPRDSSLPAIQPVSMVKEVPVPDIASRRVPPLFSSLVPPEVTLANADFREDQLQAAMKLSEQVSRIKDEGTQELDRLGLPAAVEARGSTSGLPDTLWHRIRCVQATVRHMCLSS